MSITNFYQYGPDRKDVKHLVIMLHGVGSNGQDLISLAPIFSMGLEDVAFLSPDAPFVCDMVPPGYPNAFQWFSLQDRDPHVMLSGVQDSLPLVEQFIEQRLEEYDVPASKLVLLGFSQGTMTSLHVAPRLKEEVAGVLGYSGALLWDVKANADDLQKMPIHLIHGEADDVVPVDARMQAQDTLEKSGFSVSGHTTPGLAHSIDQAGIESGLAFLQKVLK